MILEGVTPSPVLAGRRSVLLHWSVQGLLQTKATEACSACRVRAMLGTPALLVAVCVELWPAFAEG